MSSPQTIQIPDCDSCIFPVFFSVFVAMHVGDGIIRLNTARVHSVTSAQRETSQLECGEAFVVIGPSVQVRFLMDSLTWRFERQGAAVMDDN